QLYHRSETIVNLSRCRLRASHRQTHVRQIRVCLRNFLWSNTHAIRAKSHQERWPLKCGTGEELAKNEKIRCAALTLVQRGTADRNVVESNSSTRFWQKRDRHFPPCSLAASLFSTQLPLKELRTGLISAHPALPQQQIMDLIGKDELLKLDILPSQPLHQVNSLLERHVAIVITVNKQHWRPPSRHRRHWRRIKRQLHRLFCVGRIPRTLCQKD